MKRFILLFLGLLCIGSLKAQSKKVLFLGNSYTGVNNLPKLVYDVALSAGDTLIYDSNTPGGSRLLTHSSNATSIGKIFSNDWDHVVLQAQSQEPSLSDNLVTTEVFPHAKILCDTMRVNNFCTRPMFYMTWGRENGDASNCPSTPWVCIYEGMDSVLNKNYRQMGVDNNADVSPVGAVWHYIRDNHPNIDLYATDGSHPSPEGSYAAACAFYSMIFKKDPTQINFDFSLSPTTADTIRKAAKAIVFDSLNIWKIPDVLPIADFMYTQNVSTQNWIVIDYMDNSTDALFYHWDFGDGTTDSIQNPSHGYTANGTYNVQLVVSNCDGSDTIVYSVVVIDPSGNLDFINVSSLVNVYPNPAKGSFTIESNLSKEIRNIQILDLTGKEVDRFPFHEEDKINVDLYPSGEYLVIFNFSDNRKAIKKLQIQEK